MDLDTSLGGAHKGFPDTLPGLLAILKEGPAGDRRAALGELAGRYWKPIYRFLRISATKSNEDAKDLTQAFFLWLSEGDLLARFDPSRGAFRAWIKGVVRNFVGNHEQALARIKRGGAITMVPLDADAVIAPSDDPDRAFDRAWMNEVLARAIDRVRRKLGQVPFAVFEARDMTDEAPSYAELARRFDIRETDVMNHLAAARRSVREEVRALLSESCEHAADFDGEWKAFKDV